MGVPGKKLREFTMHPGSREANKVNKKPGYATKPGSKMSDLRKENVDLRINGLPETGRPPARLRWDPPFSKRLGSFIYLGLLP